ncbi:hypothetical protein Tco_1259684, partial [Tanacetum coccineum]
MYNYMMTLLIISQVMFVEVLVQWMPGFDPEIGKLTQRVVINPRKIDILVDVAVIATERAPFTQCLGFENVSEPKNIFKALMNSEQDKCTNNVPHGKVVNKINARHNKMHGIEGVTEW